MRVLLWLAIARLLLHLLTNGQYGFHRDELALLADARQLDWGYVAYPPLTPLLARFSLELFGDSLSSFRFFAAVAQATAMLLAGLIARDLGGRRGAQVVASLAVACVPFSMLQGSVLQYAGIDYLWWVLAAWLLLRLANGGDTRLWLALGAAIGLGMLTRYTMLFCAVGVVAAVLATPLRRQLSTPWPWAGAVVSLLLFAPNAWWQWQHDLVYLDFVEHIHARDVEIGRTDGFWLGQLYVNAHPLLLPLWLAGLAWLVVARDNAGRRALACLYLVPALLFYLAQARAYYLAPAYPMLLAAGAVAGGHWLAGMRQAFATWLRAVGWIVLSAALATTAMIGLPLAPIGSPIWDASRDAHDNFAEQVGWPELVASVAAVYHALPEAERARTGIFASNYGEAGAIDHYGGAHGLPKAISVINSYWYRGYGDPAPETLIIVGQSADDIADLPATCVVAGNVRIPHGVVNEESTLPDIFVCRDLRFDWAKAWPMLQEFG